ncbi:DUF2157 domain-containing protein [Peribacillus sp. SCS-37]|uniref:DUF2157 domain-containing protein n=1 Tax=Paraperibacillus esterisolvens TaxID=3115296 RepID=UPI0039067EBE
MAERKITSKEYEFLKKELSFLNKSGVISDESLHQAEKMYAAQETWSFARALLYFGSILIGAGILSVVAGNWEDIARPFKLAIIIVLFLAANIGAYSAETRYPKTSRSLYYLGGLIFGSGIFLVGQMFHFGGEFQAAFLWWGIGILPLAWKLRDKWVLAASSLFILIFLSSNSIWDGSLTVFLAVLPLAAVYLLNHINGFSRVVSFMNGAGMILWIAVLVHNTVPGIENREYLFAILFLVIGLFLVWRPFKKERGVYPVLGHLVHGAAAFSLTFQDTWGTQGVNFIFTLFYVLLVLFFIHRGSLMNILILCVLILRFYIDISFDFLPKSLVFILGGLILLGFGYYFEKQRRQRGGHHE